jgi:hypothetical protein
MPGIALKNFRGFSRAIIPLRGVNFFVGENSTGKTSVLALLEILSDHSFYYSHELASTYTNFSAFEDAISAKTPRADLAVGYFRLTFSKLKHGTIDALAFHFFNDKGTTGLRAVHYLSNGFLVSANFRKRVVEYSVKKAKLDLLSTSHPVASIPSLMDEDLSAISGEEVRSGNYSYSNLPMPSPLISALNVLALEKIKHTEEDPSFRPRIRPSLLQDLKWIAPIRAKPQGISTKIQNVYSPEGEHIPSVIRRAFGSKPEAALANRIKTVIAPFGKDSHLFVGIGVQEYGKGPTSPFEVQVQLSGSAHRLSDVGYGVSQSLPILLEIASSSINETFIVQQPEVHLHPRAQASFGEFFYDMARTRQHRFFIETHSDFLIDRFRLQMQSAPRRKNPPSQILFFKKNPQGFNVVDIIALKNDGSLPDKLPAGYRDFFLHEELKLLSIR